MPDNSLEVLVIEDEADIRTLIVHALKKEGYAVSDAATGEEGLRLAEARCPGLILLDLMLPGMDGVAVCRRIRANALLRDTRIMMLTARGEDEDVVAGLEAGADEYVTKPFSNRVLMARVRSLLRRGGTLDDGEESALRIVVGEITLVPERHEVFVGTERVELTSSEFKTLQVMMRRPGVVFTRDQLLDQVHGTFHAVTHRAVDVQIVGLRRKLGPAGAYIDTVRGAGYRLLARSRGNLQL